MGIRLLFCFGLAAGCLLAGKILIHYFQLESYQFPGYFRTVRRNLLKAILPGTLMTTLLFVLTLLIRQTDPESGLVSVLILTAVLISCGFVIGRCCAEKNAKKALAYTPRIKRYYATGLIVMMLIPLLVICLNGTGNESGTRGRLTAAFLIIYPALLPFWIALTGLLAWPVEKAISEMYFRDAQKILKSRNDLIRIGITGSWGKTSVKFILGTMLEEKYHTLVTPASFNTPMGVTKVIRSSLEPAHRVFVAEMGARHVGDIREMCRLVHPQMGILTSVGPQHLDTFKTVERVAQTKYELIEALPPDGTAFFADDGELCSSLYAKTEKDKMISGLDPQKDDVWAEEIRVSADGSTFFLCTKEMRVPCKTVLLGELNIRNILLCSCVCMKLGLSKEQIVRGIAKLNPVEHRLQLITNPGRMTIIDDAFNSNIKGAEQAFRVLKNMPGKRILVTPGMVELGTLEEEMNRSFGRLAANCCDLAILIGRKRSTAIREGLEAGGLPADGIAVVNSLDEATELLRSVAGSGDTVLFENDLPDNYTE